jgi:DNA-binding winged helix-turn-helix (wHTH) protein
LEAIEDRRLGEMLGNAHSAASPAARILVPLVDAPSFPLSGAPLDILAGVARTLGAQRAFVMVDGLDEFPFQAPDPEDQAAFLSPLLADARLMEHPFFKFKCFFPTALRSALRTRDEIRMDRLPSQTVFWPDETLRALLRERLKVYSDSRVESLTAPNVAQDIDARLVRWANGSPRTLLELGEDLLCVHGQGHDAAVKLTQADLEAIEARFQDQYAPDLVPRLHVDEESGQVSIDGQAAALVTGMELKLLLFLYRHADQIKSKDDIWRQVYGYDAEGVSQTAIDSLVHRVRKKIERDVSNPVYLMTVRGKGYRLVNTIQGRNDA